MAEVMQTYRMVAETEHGPMAIDVLLRGDPAAIAEAHDMVRAWLDVGCGYAGAWVDNGTRRTTVTRSVSPPTPCDHPGDPVVSCRECGAVAIIDDTAPAPIR